MMKDGLGDGVFEMQDLFDSDPHQRIPKIIAATDGTVLAFARSGGLMRRSEDAGLTWGPVQKLESGGGNSVIDENTGDVLIVRPSTSHL